MIKVINEFPNNVLAIKAEGTFTSKDYQQIVIPELENKSQMHRRISVLYQIKTESIESSNQELWQDFYKAFSTTRKLERLAVVTENRFIRVAMEVIGPRLSLSHRVFREKDLEAAENWIQQGVFYHRSKTSIADRYIQEGL